MSTTRVVNLRREPYDIYIGRGSRWGNPYAVGRSMHPSVIAIVETPEEAVERFRAMLWDLIKSGKVTLRELAELHGKTLGCYCDGPCHGHVLAAAAEWAASQLGVASA